MADPLQVGMLVHLSKLQSLRGTGVQDAKFRSQVLILKRWQSERLARTYADLSAQTRYAPAVDYFLNDLYAAKDFAQRDAEMIRIYPTLKKLLPQSMVETVGLALELDALTEELDQELAREVFAQGNNFTEARYVEAFRHCGSKSQRLHQVELIDEVGKKLDAAVGKPLIYSALKLLRRPAKLSGLGELQQFLEHGFTAFRHMNGAQEFLATIVQRENEIITRIFSGHPAPFSPAP